MSEKNKNLKNKFSIASLDNQVLENAIEKAANESIKSTFSKYLNEDEKKNQKNISKKIDDLNLRSENDKEEVQDEQEEPLEDSSEEQKTDTSSPKVKVQKLPSAMTPDDIARVLNIIRAGKSLKDGETRKSFEVWWDLLNSSEKIALKAFLDGIAQIVTGDVSAEEASKPSMEPYSVEMSSEPKQSARKPEKISKPSTKPEEIKSDELDQSPIIVGEVNSAANLKSRMVD